MSYSFEDNLKKLSYSPIDYKKEWSIEEIVSNDGRSTENRCICNRHIKTEYICRNEINGNVIIMGSSCVKKILGLDEDTGKAKEIAKKNNIRLFEKGLYIEISDLSQYVLDVLRDYMRYTCIQEILKWMDMYEKNPIMLAVIQSVYQEKLHQELRLQKEAAEEEERKHKEAAEKEEHRLLSEKMRQKKAAKKEEERLLSEKQ
jgi:hypothetical protein